MSNRNIYVYWDASESSILMGVLNSDAVRGKEVFSFDYDESWLSHNDFRLLDPDLRQFTGPQYLHDKPNFGIFLDSSPDRWGRMLIKRREGMLAQMSPMELVICH